MKKLWLLIILLSVGCYSQHHTPVVTPPAGLPEAPTGFDNLTNGFTTQAQHDLDRAQFEEDAGDELGPLFNARSCLDCHSNPVTGGNSQVTEHRIAPDDQDDSIAAATLIRDQAIPGTMQQVAPVDAINALRVSLDLLGDGFVEQVPDAELKSISKTNGGQFIMVPVLESPGVSRIGRFGHKDQHASLLSFAADADLNEKGVCNRLVNAPSGCPIPTIEDQQSGSTTGCSDPNCEDIDFYASFIRALKAPPRGPINSTVMVGQKIFNKIGCADCHTPTLYTSTVIFHPFGDYLLHDVGTGDSIPQGAAPASKIRTSPLWGLRVKSRFLHDSSAYDLPTALQRHGKEAAYSAKNFQHLTKADKQNLLAFLNSL
jgi:CxxC motif-containing protein (DUF1111 family)